MLGLSRASGLGYMCPQNQWDEIQGAAVVVYASMYCFWGGEDT